METIQQDIDYRGYIISPVFKYYGGKLYDWQIYKKDADYGTIYRAVTLEEVKESIDELINEQ
jgi:hypothetical protein